MRNYTIYHLHSDLSLLDSCTKFKDYVDKAVSCGMKSICFTEHGNIYNWIEKKMYCDKNGIKYLHGCEVYLTNSHDNKVRDNYHTILISKNSEGFKELNNLIDLSTQPDHFYYNNRLSFEEFLNISDNIIKISSCLASPLNKLPEDHPMYEKLLKHYDYYEIQYHAGCNGDQIRYNQKLYEFSKKYNKPLIAGTDTHNIDKYKAECRNILKKAKKMTYDNEDDFDLTFKSYDELVEMFRVQNSLPIEVVLDAIENTNRMADACDEVILDTSYKYPKLSDNDEELFVDRILEKCRDKIDRGVINKDKRYIDSINEEIRVFQKLGMCSFMLFMSELCTWCRENGIPTGFCRGSVGGSVVAYMLDIIDLDPIVWDTVFSRFCNEDRIEIGDIDLDFSPSQRELVYNYIINRFGYDKSAYILAIGTISDKGTIDEIGRALGYPLSLVDDIKKLYESNKEEALDKYKELFYYFDGLINTSISQSLHPAGIVASPVTLPDNYGAFWKDGKRILQINMEEIHEVNLVKYDILGLKNIEIIKDTYELLGKPYPLSHEINWDDKKVWDNCTVSPVGFFQFESDFAFNLLKRYKPQKINDLSLINASLRPSGASYRDRLIAGEINHNPSELIDDLLKDNNGFLVFQEDIIAFLQKVCCLSGSEADNVRRAIGRKQFDRLEKALPKILEGYCAKSTKERAVAEEEAKEFLQIIEDASNYMFGKNHSTGYSMIGYLCVMLRYYYPLEFITAFLNNANNEDDVVAGTLLAQTLNIKIKPPTFRYSKGKYHPDKTENAIFKGIGSIKYLNETMGEELYFLRDIEFTSFVDLLVVLTEETSLNSRAINILIKLGFFREFGGNRYLYKIYEYFQSRYKKALIQQTKQKRLTEVKSYADLLDKNDEFSIREVLEAQMEYLGYIDYVDDSYNSDIVIVTKVKVNSYGTPFADIQRVKDGSKSSIKINKQFFNEITLNDFDTIQIVDIKNKPKVRKVNGKWEQTGENELILQSYRKVV